MTFLAERLRERIRRDGPMAFREWMQAALYDEHGGYYNRSELTRWGRAGDYRTSPERSPLFAATFGRYFAKLFQELGSPSAWTIVEAGAGAGDFAHGVLDGFRRKHPTILSATKYIIDEASPDAGERVRQRTGEFAYHIEFKRLDQLANRRGVGVVFANELLDAFPVHRVTMREGKLHELHVGVDDEDRFAWIERDPSTPRLKAYLEDAGVALAEGQIAEINLDVEDWVTHASRIFERGYLIIVDYGAEAEGLYASHRREGTLRAFHRHTFVDDLLANPGEQDLTTTIDWTNVKRVGERLGFQTVSFDRQDQFLLREGLIDELEMITADSETETDEVVLRSSVRELILPGGMSERFQVLVQSRLS